MRGISCIINIYLLVVSLVNKNKSSKTILILSLLLTCFFAYATVSGVFFNTKHNQYLNSEEFYIENAKSLERSLADSAKYIKSFISCTGDYSYTTDGYNK